ncbi:MAG: type II toxin-antitoxin system prevent-host-death family antitoxin [Devosia sp.]|nr:type II toxin-antitoxin system prevent-host-death family antitoxin [Devosia sp.]
MNKHPVPALVQLRDAKANLSSLVSAAERGEETIITRHGKPVAKIVPVPAAAEPKRVDHPGSPYHGMTFLELLMAFPGGTAFERDRTPMRETNLE